MLPLIIILPHLQNVNLRFTTLNLGLYSYTTSQAFLWELDRGCKRGKWRPGGDLVSQPAPRNLSVLPCTYRLFIDLHR